MIQNAETSYEQSVENAETRANECAEQANELLETVFEEYVLPEIEYGHFSVVIDNYVNTLNLQSSGVRRAFFSILHDLGYETSVSNIAITETRNNTMGTLRISWSQDRHCNDDFGWKK